MSFVNLYNIGGSSRPNKVTGSHAAQMLGTLDINIKFVWERNLSFGSADSEFINPIGNLPEVQHQIGVSDCGLFALAFATSIFFGEDSSTLQHNQAMMR